MRNSKLQEVLEDADTSEVEMPLLITFNYYPEKPKVSPTYGKMVF